MRKFPTAADLEEMKARGYCASVIAEAQELSARGRVAEGLKGAIRSAFAGVTLGGGVGLNEGQAIDGYAKDTIRAACREKDEKNDWTALDAESLNRCNSSFSFFDAEGMRFHLPAYLIAELECTYGFDLPYALTQATAADDRWTLLNAAQRNVVREFLQFALDEPDHASERGQIEWALANYWAR